jgi:hypothetical protein
MASLHDIMAYFAKNYPHKSELSKARLTKMVYLADWKSALVRQKQMTDISWFFNHFGPYVDDIHATALKSDDFNVVTQRTFFGNLKQLITLKDKPVEIAVTSEEQEILDHVIAETKGLQWGPFIKLVYSTYPVLTGVKGEPLDLVASAAHYSEILQALDA